mgnify:CR=1 FL=1
MPAELGGNVDQNYGILFELGINLGPCWVYVGTMLGQMLDVLKSEAFLSAAELS